MSAENRKWKKAWDTILGREKMLESLRCEAIAYRYIDYLYLIHCLDVAVCCTLEINIKSFIARLLILRYFYRIVKVWLNPISIAIPSNSVRHPFRTLKALIRLRNCPNEFHFSILILAFKFKNLFYAVQVPKWNFKSHCQYIAAVWTL